MPDALVRLDLPTRVTVRQVVGRTVRRRVRLRARAQVDAWVHRLPPVR